jgi:hypothetical protein
MSEIKVNKLSPRTNCGTVTLGDSGDTFTIPAGATITNNGTQTGFGRTGTVDWDTTAKTASFTAVSGNGYFVNTTSGAITVTLPASPSAGDIVGVADYAGTAATNNITIARNGSNFEGGTEDGGIVTNRQTGTFVYADATQGWIAVNSNDASFILPSYVSATGGTITCCGDYKIHTFTSPGTFTVCSVGNPLGSTSVDYLVVAGGGGSAAGGGSEGGGAGGAGGYRESSGAASGCYTVSPLGACVSALPVTVTGYPITVGAGGSGGPGASLPEECGSQGSNSIFSSIISTGGGYGGRAGPGSGPTGVPGGSGGSGGGGGNYVGGPGSGNTPPVSPPQGQNGGTGGAGSPGYTAAGGGGATSVGGNGTSTTGGGGGSGATSLINGTSTTRSGGGGGGTHPDGTGGAAGPGGGGAGGDGASGTAGTANTGGGAGGSGGSPGNSGATGGSGIVIIRYKFQ